MKLTVPFEEVEPRDIQTFGGKVCALGELTAAGFKVPKGYGVTTDAYRKFIEHIGLADHIAKATEGLSHDDATQVGIIARGIRRKITEADMPAEIANAIIASYHALGDNEYVAVRSSATAEDGVDASYAGLQDTHLYVQGDDIVVERVKDCWASYFTDRALQTRLRLGHNHTDGICVGVQIMVESEWAGTMFTIDQDKGNPDLVKIEVCRGLGVGVVSGGITPDKITYSRKRNEIVNWTAGHQPHKLVRREVVTNPRDPHYDVPMTPEEGAKSVLEESGIMLEVVKIGLRAHEYYETARDMEWAINKDGEIFVVQARPVTAKSLRYLYEQDENLLPKEPATLLARSISSAIGGIASGYVRILDIPEDAGEDYELSEELLESFGPNDILVTRKTLPNIVPLMRKVRAVVTGFGGTTSHAAIIAREEGLITVVGADGILDVVHDGMFITVDATYGCVFEGRAETRFEADKDRLERLKKLFHVVSNLDFKTPISVILANPKQSAEAAEMGAFGVGLFRIENEALKNNIHPYQYVLDNALEVYTQLLTASIVEMASPHFRSEDDFDWVGVRFYDSKSNEHAHLQGFKEFLRDVIKAVEENPHMGLRGVSLFLKLPELFLAEVEAVRRAREVYGLKNVAPMLPFVRTPEELDQVLALMAKGGLRREDGVPIWVMAEIPSNFIMPELFIFRPDGSRRLDVFSIGSNDGTSFLFGMDRENGSLRSNGASEDHPISRKMISMLIHGAHQHGVKVRICGQGPSNSVSLLEFLLDEGIDGISVNPDTFLQTALATAEHEAKLRGETLDIESLLEAA